MSKLPNDKKLYIIACIPAYDEEKTIAKVKNLKSVFILL